MQPTKLADKVILVKLTMRRASLTKRDAYLSDKIQRQEGDASLTVLTKLFKSKDNPISQIMSKYGEAYTYHKTHTLPYVDAGPRILPNDLYFEYTQEIKHRIAMMENLKRNYMPHYDQLVLEDVAYRNSGHAAGRAHVSDYPTAEQFGDAQRAFLQAQGAKVGDMNEAVLFTFADVDEGGIDTGQHVLDGAQVDITNLIAALGHNQFVNTFVGEHCSDSQLLGNDDLLGHGGKMDPWGPDREGKGRNGKELELGWSWDPVTALA